jgi:transposase
MAAKIIYPSLPPVRASRKLYNRAWRALTGKKYKPSEAARKRKNEHARIKRHFVKSVGKSRRNQKVEPNVAVDTRSKTIADIEAKFAEIDRLCGGKL